MVVENERSYSSQKGPLAGICRRLGIHYPTFTVCILQFGSVMIGVTFQFYYVKVFLNHYKITQGWFQLAQTLFLIWNSINDPLFGYWQDTSNGWVGSRTKSILYGAPLYALSFLLFWFPWGGESSSPTLVGIHLITALFLYDGVFSFTLLAWCALFAELTTDPGQRVRVVKYMQIATCLGVNVIFFLEKASDSLQDFHRFQMGTVVCAIIGFLCCAYTGLYASRQIAQVASFAHITDAIGKLEGGNFEEVSESSRKQGWKNGWQVAKQIVAAKDFRKITATNLIHTMRTTCHLNFVAIITEGLIPRDVLPLGSWQISTFYGVCALVPQILLIINAGLIERHGAYQVMMWSFVSSSVCGAVVFCIGRGHPYIVMLFFLIDSVQVHSFSPLMFILFPDFIDDDMIRHKRKSPMSSMVFGLNALFTKPAQSVAPMIAVYCLNLFHYEEYKNHKLPEDSAEMGGLRDCMFALLTLTPVVFGFMQYQLLHGYSLKDKHLDLSLADNEAFVGAITTTSI